MPDREGRKQKHPASSGKPPAWPDATRARAVRLGRDKSGPEVSEITGVPEGTIRRWWKEARDRDGGDPLPANASPAERTDWAAKKEAAAEEAFDVAQDALAEVRRLLAEGKQLAAQRTALTFAITTDKSGVLEDAAAAAVERQVRIAEEHGQLLAQVIVRTLTDLGLPTQAATPVIRHYLAQASEGGPLVGPAPGADAARQAVVAEVLADWEGSLPPEERLALPAGESESATVEGEAVERGAEDEQP